MRPTAAPRVLLAHPTGNEFFRQLARAWRAEQRLAELCTCLDWRGPAWLEAQLPAGLVAELNRRGLSRATGGHVRTHPWREAARLTATRLRGRALTRHETGVFSVDAVYRDFDRWVAHRIARGAVTAEYAYAYEDAAADTFAAAAARGWSRVYDLPIAHWTESRRLLAEEAARWPEWAPTLLGPDDSGTKLARKTQELELATHIVCPSMFVAQSLPAAVRAARTVIVAPFGSPAPCAPREPRTPNGALRVLFAGAMTQRKGLADLFAAVRLLPAADLELVVMGSAVLALDFYRATGVRFTYEPPRPHAAVLELMRSCDVLCLPSVVEGRALVVQEAMSQGLPVIVTANTGTDDVVRDGENGFLVPIRSPQALADRLAWCLAHRPQLPRMGSVAQAAAARLTWPSYVAALNTALFPAA
ncbi:MAG: glycosyltransferase family 4 protein [Candidatus Didemnitutus sp.]|nr:glycosyltransferase family 4 protein [Candidatus Didemnitutus sp.]